MSDVWQLFVKPRLRFRSVELLVCNDAELGYPSRHYGVMWVSQMSAEHEPRLQQRRITFARGTAAATGMVEPEPSLDPTGWTPMQAGQAQRPHKDTPFPVGGLELGCRDVGIPSTACLEFVVRGDCASDAGMLAQYTVGACSISLLQLYQRLHSSVVHYPVFIRVPLILRASQDTSTAVIELEVVRAHFDSARMREVFDASMLPFMSGPVLMMYASLGWMHLPRDDLDGSERVGDILLSSVGLKPLIPVASRSMVPFCNESSGVLPVDLFFRVHNSPHLPRPDEQHWKRLAEQAFWLRGLTPAEALTLCERNFPLQHYEPRFELVISAVNKMFSQRGTSFPYRSDLATMVTAKGKVVRKGTDFFWQCESQRSGDCEDSDKTIKDQIDLFMSRKMNDPLLRYVQRLCACWVPGSVLANVTSPSLKHEEHTAHAEAAENGGSNKPDGTPFTPLAELECGLHAVCVHYPLVQFRRDLAACAGEDAVAKLDFFSGICVSEQELPQWADEIEMAVLEGTGNLDSRLQTFRTYVERQLSRMGAADAAKHLDTARELVAQREAQMVATRSVLALHPALMETLGAKPEMAQFNTGYEYDFGRIWAGHAAPASHFYVAGVEFYTDRLLNAGHKYCRFAFVTRANVVGGSTSDWLKVAPFDALVAGDPHVGMWPQPPLTEDVLKCALVLANRMEPISYVDYHEQDAAVDAVIRRAQHAFGTPTDYASAAGAGLVTVDLHFQNGLLAGEKLVPRVDSVATELRRTSYVKATTFRLLDHGAGIVSGVLRLYVDATALVQARQLRIEGPAP